LLLCVSFNAPHLPNEAPADAIARYSKIPNPFRRTHAAMVSELDTAIGRVIDALAAEGMLENTLVWFMSDNGGLNPDALGGGLRDAMVRLQGWFGTPLPNRFLEFLRINALEGGSDNRPLRRGKGSAYEGGTRVPSLIYWRGTIAPGRVAGLVTVQDILPTLLGAAGHPVVSAKFDGANLWPMLTGAADVAPPDYVTHGQDGEAYYRFPWKLLELSSSEHELYNLAADPTELNDLAAQEPAIVADLSAALARFPRGPSVDLPLYEVVWDPDFFGGKEDREPWADRVK
jgi:arylsulfatase A-like enzyme